MSIKTIREAETDDLTALGKIIQASLGFELADLEALDADRLAGQTIDTRLGQLNLVDISFAYLMRIRGLALAAQPILESEWETVYNTLTQARLQRESSVLRAEEKTQGILLGPEFFVVATELSTPLPFLDQFIPRWLSTRQARSDWQDTLQSRIDQQDAIQQGLDTANGAVEELTLPVLRNALIQASDAAGASTEEKGEWITSRLLIDARAGGCQTTTRAAQAIETIRTLIFDIRTGQFRQLTAVPLSLVSDNFDDEWKWLGSYATFRAATFVFLYPENILQPSLLKDQTPGFRTLVSNTRGKQLNTQTAAECAQAYASYFRDLCTLRIEATCQASTVVEGITVPSMFYMFGRAASGKIYWSAWSASLADSQRFWEEIPDFADTEVIRIVGAMPYRKPGDAGGGISATFSAPTISAYVHLFCVVTTEGNTSLRLARLDLNDFGIWAAKKDLSPSSPLPFTFALEIVPVQTQSDRTPPGLVFHLPASNSFHYRTLNGDGTDWEPGDWPVWQNIIVGGPWPSIRAVLLVNGTFWFILFRTFNASYAARKIAVNGFGGLASDQGGTEALGSKIAGALPGLEFRLGLANSDLYVFAVRPDDPNLINSLHVDNSGIVNSQIFGGVQVPPSSGTGSDAQKVIAILRDVQGGSSYMTRYTAAGGLLVFSPSIKTLPSITVPVNIPLHLSPDDLQTRRKQIITAFGLNDDAPPAVMAYLREAYYFVPVHLALTLQASGQYLAALDCIKTVYDYEAPVGPPSLRNIYFGLELDANLPDASDLQQADGWLLDPLNPHSIAASRRLAYTRFTLVSVLRCMLDFADSQFSQDSAESLATARTLYLTALGLLNLPELQQNLAVCEHVISSLKIAAGNGVPPEVPAAVARIQKALKSAALPVTDLEGTAEQVGGILKGKESWKVRLAKARAVALKAIHNAPAASKLGAAVNGKSSVVITAAHALLLAQPGVDDKVQLVGKFFVARMFDGANRESLAADFSPSLSFCIPPNPIVKALRLHAELSLFKLRSCRNIAGLKRELNIYAAPTDATSGLPSIGGGGQLLLPGTVTVLPSLYRYPALIERAKQLVQLAAQMEASLLSAIEKADSEAQNLLQAKQQLNLARAGVQLQDLRVTEAKDGVDLAKDQMQRAQIQETTYDAWITADANDYEKQMIQAYTDAATAQKAATDSSTNIQTKQSAISSAQLAAQVASVSGELGVITGPLAGETNFVIDQLLFDDLNTNTKRAITRTADAQIASVNAALERRKDEWNLQLDLAKQDLEIGKQQVTIATDHQNVTAQERVIAGIQSDNAKDMVDFLTNKFTSVELFDWMGNVLQGVYRFFLQQATAMARLAENQLAFERQEVPPSMIMSDYWQLAPDGGTAGQGTDGNGTGRRGLTGSARLLQDIFQLDQYAFTTNKRKLSLTKTFSMARLVPAEFQRFRETGVLPFSTTMDMFDRGFPGHYLRLIKRVRISVVALVPAVQGIYATLSTTGPSRVVVGGDLFQTVTIRRAPESLPICAPSVVTGVVELDAQPDLLLPFEGSGVDISWEFSMPKAANLFDYLTIADVVMTLEYSALQSADYRQQVIQSFKPKLTADYPLSFRSQFPDQWYDLHNPEQSATPMTVRFATQPEDFPPNVDALKIQQILMYFVRSNGASFEIPVNYLHYKAQQESGSVGGGATSIDGVVSTRRGNASSWTIMIGKSPIGEWELALPNTEEVRNRFKNDEVEDILCVITYSGRTPDWPS